MKLGLRKPADRDSLCLLTLLLCISDSVFVAVDFLMAQGKFHILQF